jgi:hypothetical protein
LCWVCTVHWHERCPSKRAVMARVGLAYMHSLRRCAPCATLRSCTLVPAQLLGVLALTRSRELPSRHSGASALVGSGHVTNRLWKHARIASNRFEDQAARIRQQMVHGTNIFTRVKDSQGGGCYLTQVAAIQHQPQPETSSFSARTSAHLGSSSSFMNAQALQGPRDEGGS